MRVGAPECKYNGKLMWGFWEDPVTAAYNLVTEEALPAGTPLAVHGFSAPPWFWQATGLDEGEGGWRIDLVNLPEGPLVVLCPGEPVPVSQFVARALAGATPLDKEQAQALERATSEAAQDGDYPLGAHVMPARHDDVLRQRLHLQEGPIATWTRVGAGAAPSEFARMQHAAGAYYVVMVNQPEGRTVGIWTGSDAPDCGQLAKPVLLRLFKREGAWRYGVGFAPTL